VRACARLENRPKLRSLLARPTLPCQLAGMTPYRAEDRADWPAFLRLIQTAFAVMEGRIDPPSSMHGLTPDSIAAQARAVEVWGIGTPPVACVFLTPRPDALYVGKLAVDAAHRRKGLGRRLIDLAETRARALALPALELQTRVELTENHATFRALGFREIARTAHPGFDRPTSITFRRSVA
jgi:ribosomal protein S18 acetylase RimI-like enzyme